MIRGLATVFALLIAAMPAQAAVTLQEGEVGIVHGCDSDFLRRIVVPGKGERPLVALGPGECVLVQPQAAFAALSDAAIRAAIAQATGRPARAYGDDRAVVVDDKIASVIAVVLADPAVDLIPGKIVMLHPEAVVGDQYQAGEFKRLYAVVDDKTGMVIEIALLPLPSEGPVAPAKSTLYPVGSLKVGDAVPIDAKPIALAVPK